MIYRVTDKINELSNLRENSNTRGERTGFKPLDDNLSLKKGYPLFVAGAPHSGKTELILEILLNTSVIHGWKHFVYLGENGDIEEQIADLCSKLIMKPFVKSMPNAMSESERLMAEMFINDHFVFLSDEKDIKLKDFYKYASEAEKRYNIRFDTTLFDPFNDALDESIKYGGTHHWLNHELKHVRRISKENKRIDILINHIADIQPTIDRETGKAYLRPALPNEWNGGRTWWRRGFLMLLIYRPPAWLKDDNGIPYGENVSLVIVQKAKPKGIATYGSTSKLFWDWKKNRYYWIDGRGDIQFAFKFEEKQVTLAINQNNEDYDELPY